MPKKTPAPTMKPHNGPMQFQAAPRRKKGNAGIEKLRRLVVLWPKNFQYKTEYRGEA